MGPQAVEVKPEFGNTEQIKLIDAYKKASETFEIGLPLTARHYHVLNAALEFYCVCGHDVSRSGEADNMNDVDCLTGSYRCPRCHKSYMVTQIKDKEVKVSFWK